MYNIHCYNRHKKHINYNILYEHGAYFYVCGGVQMGHDVLCQILNVQYNKNKMNSKNIRMMTTARKHHGNQNHWKQQYLHRRLYPFLPRNNWINLYKNCGLLKRLILKTNNNKTSKPHTLKHIHLLIQLSEKDYTSIDTTF